ncbi:MAG: hypothetical protein AAGG48_30545 [Planctomycetota bacterium]
MERVAKWVFCLAEYEHRKRFEMVKFRIKSLLVFVFVIAVLMCWYGDHTRLANENARLEAMVIHLEERSVLSGRDFRERRRVTKALSGKSDRESLALLLYALSDSDYITRKTAFMALQRIDQFDVSDTTTVSGGEVAALLKRYFDQPVDVQ